MSQQTQTFLRKLRRIISSSLCSCLQRTNYIPCIQKIRQVFAFSPSSKPYHTFPLVSSGNSFLRFSKLFCFSPQRLFRVGAVTKQQAIVSKVFEKLFLSSTFSCAIAVRQSLDNALYYSFLWLQDLRNMGIRFLRWKQSRPSFSSRVTFYNFLQFLLSAWDRGRALGVRGTQVRQVT